MRKLEEALADAKSCAMEAEREAYGNAEEVGVRIINKIEKICRLLEETQWQLERRVNK